MKVGIGLPNTLSIDGTQMVAWARRAEERGFTALGTIDRIVYPTYDSLTALAVAAGATSRIGLFTDILLAPLYPAAVLAKATASLHAMSGGRFTLGVAVGGRPDDYAAVERPFEHRGRILDETLHALRRAWAGEPIAGGDFAVGPPPAGGGRVPLLVGGQSDATIRRVVEYGDGWTVGGSAPDAIAPMHEKVTKAWHEAGREGEPRMAALAYFGLGDAEASAAALLRYYGFLGDYADMIAGSALRTPDQVRAAVAAYDGAGITELYLMPTVASVDEVDRLADVVL